MGNGPYDLLSGIYRKHLDAFEAAAKNVKAAQGARRNEILAANAGTDYVMRHGGELPLATYDDLAADVERIKAGEANVLTAEAPTSFVRTSGTTGASKWIPITPSLSSEVGRAQVIWMVEMLRENPKHADGVALTLVSSGEAGHTAGGTPYGANTGRMRSTMPWYVRWAAVPPQEVLAVEDRVARAYLTVLYAAGADVGTLSTANPTSVLQLVQRLSKWRGALIEDLMRGGAPSRVLDDDGNEHAFGQRLRRKPRRRRKAADRLREATSGGILSLRTLWPRLTTVNCWQGGSAPFFLGRLAENLDGLPVRDPGYSASEGFFAIPLDSGTASGALYVNGPFFEFKKEGDDEIRLAHELEEGAEYRVFITTTGGLYRYDMSDVVRVDGFWHEAPMISFVRKADGILNTTGEKVTSAHVTAAVTKAGVALRAFTMTFRLDVPPVLVLLAEADGDERPDFAAAVEAALQQLNEEYQEKRISGRMAPLEVKWLAPGTFERLRAERIAAGAPETQVKLPAVLPPSRLPPILGQP